MALRHLLAKKTKAQVREIQTAIFAADDAESSAMRDRPRLRCRRQRLNRSQILGQRLARKRQVIVRLQVQPELGFHAEVDAQARGGVGSDAALAGDDFADAALRHADLLGQPVLGDAQRLEEFFQQDFAGHGERDLTFGHDGMGIA